MMLTRELMLMIAQFLFGDYDTNEFSFDFPSRLSFVYKDFLSENNQLCDYLEDQMQDLCAAFDPYDTGDPETLDEKTFRSKVLVVYMKALQMVALTQKAV